MTISTQGGAYLIAFLALYVRIAGNAFWDLLRAVIFLLRSTQAPKDGLFHQQQLLLRSTSDIAAVWQFWTLGRHWHGRARSPWLRSLPIVLTAIIHVIIFSAAGVFVSRVTSTHSDVLLKPTICGLWSDPYASSALPDSPNIGNEWDSQNQHSLNVAGAYAASCYEFNSSHSSQSCNAYGRSTLTWNVTTDVQCPFAPEMCIGGHSVLLDSGQVLREKASFERLTINRLIDSHLDLGINAKASDRLQYRQTLHCSPLETEGFYFKTSDLSDPRIPDDAFVNTAIVDNISWVPPGTEVLGFQYGPNPFLWNKNALSNTSFIFNNWTFGISGDNVNPSVYLFR